jgi:hypothetical protein
MKNEEVEEDPPQRRGDTEEIFEVWVEEAMDG